MDITAVNKRMEELPLDFRVPNFWFQKQLVISGNKHQRQFSHKVESDQRKQKLIKKSRTWSNKILNYGTVKIQSGDLRCEIIFQSIDILGKPRSDLV